MSESTRRTGAGCLGGILGALAGIIIGGFAVPWFMGKPASDPNLPVLSGIAGFIGSMAELVVTLVVAGLLGIAGAIGGSIYGSRRAVSESSPLPEVEENTIDKHDVEIAELKRRLAELEGTHEKKVP